MGGLTALGIRSLLARPLRSALTLVGIALGVAVLFASLATSAGIDAAVERTVADLTGRSDMRVGAFLETGLRPDSVAAIESAPGIAVAAPAIERRTYLGPELVGPDDELPPPVTVLAVDPAREPAVRDLALVAGRALAPGDDAAVLVTETLATDDALGIGAELTIQGDIDAEPFRGQVVGILAGRGPLHDADGRTVVLPLAIAGPLFATDGADRVDVVLAEGAGLDATIDALGDRLVAEPYTISTAADSAAALRASTGDFQGLTALIAAVALFAGAFLIFNTLSMTVSERFREVGLLRAAGATRGQLTRSILVQAGLLGLVGSLAGVVLGAGLAIVLAGQVGAAGAIGAVPLERPVLTVAAALGALLAGTAVTLAAALEPARRAGRISPIEALRPSLQDARSRRARLAWVIAVFAVVGAVGLVAWPAAAGTTGIARAAALYAVLLGAILILPAVLAPLSRVAGLPFALLLRLEERLARGGLGRDPGRAALTIGALTVALAMLVALAGMGQQARRSGDAWLAEVVPGELLLTSIRPIDFEIGLQDVLAESAGVARVSPIATFDLAVGGIRTDAAAVSGADLAADGRLRFRAGDRAAALAALDAGGAAILPERIATRLGVSLGSTLTATGADGAQLELVVAGLVERTFPGRTGETVLVGWPDALLGLGVLGADAFAVRFAPNATPADRTGLEADARALALEPVPVDHVGSTIGDALGLVFGLLDLLALVAVVVAAFGIVNTLSMSVIERVREIGVLRAAGMTRRQVWRMVVVEAGIVGLSGALVGSLTGVLAAGLLVTLSGGRLEPAALVPWPAIGLALVLGVGLSMLAAAWPARIASRLPIVRAVRHE